MSYFIKNNIKNNLAVLKDIQDDVLINFCKLALDYLNNGPSDKRYSVAAKKLDFPLEDVGKVVEALVCLLIDCAKNNVSFEDFETIKTLDVSDDKISILWQFVNNKSDYVKELLKKTNIKDLRYRDLEWRLEAQVASRSLLSQAIPKITMKLYLDTEELNEHKDTLNAEQLSSCKQYLVQTDPNNLIGLISALEQALIDSKTHRTRNFVKAFQKLKTQ